MDARVLVVEDDESISDVVCRMLSHEGCSCTPAFSGSEARLLLAGGQAFDLVVCDLMLPGLSGEGLIALVRESSNVPILVISARGAVADRVTLLRLGADDYLVKPFDLDELVARVEALLRRSGAVGQAGESGEGMAFGSWVLDEEARTLVAAGGPIRLTRTEFDIVAALMRRPRKVFTKRELYEAVWHEEAAVEEKAISTHISNIRAKLRGTGTEGYIETVWGIGFKLCDEPSAG